jgi:ABC-type polysaccharide/polyol phosphate export permease
MHPVKLNYAYSEIQGAITSWRVWLLLGWQDIRLRYRRSYIGPWWITLSMLITIMCLGFLYGNLFKMPIAEYLPYLAIGMVGWTLILTLINEGAASFVECSPYLKQISLPYSVFILRILIRNIIIFFHNIIPVFLVLIFFQTKPAWAILGFIPGFLLIALNGFCYGWILAIIGARFRDIQPIISSVMQIAFFVTPIIWLPSVLPERYRFLVDYNPFAQFLELIRQPLLGHWPSGNSLLVTGIVTLIGILGMIYLINKTRRRIIFWL